MQHVLMRELPPKREARQFDGSIESYEKIRRWVEEENPRMEVFYRPPNQDQERPWIIIHGEKQRLMLRPTDWLIWDGDWQSHSESGIAEWFEIVEEVHDGTE